MTVQDEEITSPPGQMCRLLVTVDEAADALCVSRATIYKMLDDGRLPSLRLGRSRRIRRGDLEDFVARLDPVRRGGSEKVGTR
jgi:excisionase family DNA binding protein